MATEGWVEARLGDHVDLLTGFPFQSSQFSNKGTDIRLLRGDNVGQGELRWEDAKRWPEGQLDGLAKYMVEVGDVILAMDRPWIEAGLKFAEATPQDVPSLLVQRVARLRARPTLDQRFLKYIVAGRQFTDYLVGIQTGTAVPHISGPQIQGFRFPLPPLSEQRVIARTLGPLDDKIELNRRMNQTLEQIAQALFKFWFVDFGPVRAKAEGRWKKGESLPGTPADMWDLWPSEFEESEIGEIPSGWKVGPLGDVAEVVSEPEDPSSANALEPYIGLEHMESRCLAVYRTGSMRDVKTAKLRFQIGDILFGRLRPYFHKVAVAWEDGYCSTTVAVVRPRTPPWHAFLLGHMNRSDFVDFATANSNGTTMPSISTKDLLSYQVTTPPTSLVRRLTEIQTPIIARIRMAASEIRTLEGLRDALLPKLLSGEIRVPVNGGR